MIKTKWFSFFAAFVVLGGLFLGSSCTEDGEVTPDNISITFTPDDLTLAPGASQNVTYNVVAAEKIEEIRVIRDGAGTVLTLPNDNEPLTNKESHSGQLLVEAFDGDAGKTISYTFEVTDKKGGFARNSFILTVSGDDGGGDGGGDGGTDPIAIDTFNDLAVGAQGNASLGSSVDLEDGRVYSLSDARDNSARIDVVYFFTDIQNGVIAAPNDGSLVSSSVLPSIANWESRNATKLRTTGLSSGDFNAISDGSVINEAYEGGTDTPDGTRAKFLEGGEVVAFETVGGKRGLILVGSIGEGTAGRATLSVKVIK